MKKQSIPVIDLRDFSASPASRDRFVRQLGDALRDVGFFSLVGHGIDPALIERAYKVAAEFFALSQEAKAQYEIKGGNGQRGFTCFGREHAKGKVAPDLKEFWHVGQELAKDHALYSDYLPNVWPAETPEFKNTMLSLFTNLNDCAMQLLDACSLYIGEPLSLLREASYEGNSILRIINYPPIPADANPASIRAGAHEDINFITLLPEATAPGLELLSRDGSWLPVNAAKGEIIVDAGDMLQNMTNGLLKSTTHRVVNPDNSREQRFSMPFFVHPKSAVDLTPLAGCVAKTGGTAAYPSISAGAYLMNRLREIGLIKK